MALDITSVDISGISAKVQHAQTAPKYIALSTNSAKWMSDSDASGRSFPLATLGSHSGLPSARSIIENMDEYEMTDLVCPACGEAMLVISRTIVTDEPATEVDREEP